MSDFILSMKGVYTLQEAMVVLGSCVAVIFVLHGFNLKNAGWIRLAVVIVGMTVSVAINTPGPDIHGRARIAWNGIRLGVGAFLSVSAFQGYKVWLKKLSDKEDDKPKFPPTASPE